MVRFSSALAFLLFLVPIRAQDSRPASEPARSVVAVLGASVSAGFSCSMVGIGEAKKNTTMTLKRAFGAVWTQDQVVLRDFSDLMTFTDPVGITTRKVGLAKEVRPALVVAADFLFWFGYGHVRGADEAKARLALLDEGLALLDQFTCPIVVGDFPDMTGANPRMLAPAQIPSLEMQGQLNEKVRAWAKTRKHVRLFALADFVKAAKVEGEVVRFRGAEHKLLPEVLLQEDRLHATKLGVAVLALRILPEVRHLLPGTSEVLPPKVDFEGLAAALRLELP